MNKTYYVLVYPSGLIAGEDINPVRCPYPVITNHPSKFRIWETKNEAEKYALVFKSYAELSVKKFNFTISECDS